VQLTEKSTPFQIRTLELQRELHESIALLYRATAAKTMEEYRALRTEAGAALARISNTQEKFGTIGSAAQQVSDELSPMAQEFLNAVEERINSNNAAISANEEVSEIMERSSARLDDLDRSIHHLQASYSNSFAAALESTGNSSDRLRSIEELRNLVRELQLLTVTVQAMQQPSAVLIARAKLRAVAGRITGNSYYAANRAIAADINGFIKKLSGYINLQSTAIAQKNGTLQQKSRESGKDLPHQLNDLFQTLDQETILAREELTLAASRQEQTFRQSSTANHILEANSDLVELGLVVKSETSRLFTLESVEELDKLARRIGSLFSRIEERAQTVEKLLNNLNATNELTMLRSATASLASIQSRIYSAGGIVTKLRKKLQAINQASIAAEKLHAIVVKLTMLGNESISTAQAEQEQSLTAVQKTIQWIISSIFSIGITAIFIVALFGLWLYRSILLPLGLVLNAVKAQQEQGQELALLAGNVADGDLNQVIIPRDAVRIDAAQIKRDEMGRVLKAIIAMDEAQATLCRAFDRMTSALRKNRDEETRRHRVQSGLHELDKILREEQEVNELADRALTYIIGFLGAAIGILYRYNDTDEMLHPIARYAVSDPERISKGFRIGQGLVGQVAQERRILCLTPTPPGYLSISSALGAADPLTIFILPMLHGNVLAGVLELGSFKRIDDDDLDFLIQALEALSIVLNISRSRQQVNDLLERTKTQA